MLAEEFLIELKLHEDQDKITQIVTGSNGAAKHTMYDEYFNASKRKVPSKRNGKGGEGKGGKSGRCAICGLTRHYTSQCTRPVKPKAKNANWDDTTWQQEEVDGRSLLGRLKSIKRLRVRKAKARGISPRASLRGKVLRDRLHRDHLHPNPLEVTGLIPKPNLKLDPA